MKKTIKIFILLMAFLPLLLMASIQFITTDIVVLMSTVILCLVVTTVYFLTHLYKNEELKKDEKITWFIILLFVSTIAQVIYWFKYVNKNEGQKLVVS